MPDRKSGSRWREAIDAPGSLGNDESFDKAAAWQKLSDRLYHNNPKTASGPGLLRYWKTIAAVFLLAAGLAVWHSLTQKEQQPAAATLVTSEPAATVPEMPVSLPEKQPLPGPWQPAISRRQYLHRYQPLTPHGQL
ncbi:MAG: hypothetical protein QM664_11160 [Flavihumibacter sp.]